MQLAIIWVCRERFIIFYDVLKSRNLRSTHDSGC